MQTAIESTVQEQASHLESIEHGKPERLSNAMTVNEYFPQGDVYFGPVEKVPSSYERVGNPSKEDQQLVPGNTIGSRHCLDSLDGVELYHPKEWSEESLLGPVIVFNKERTVLHPTHGNITVPEGMTIQFAYQRNYNQQLKAEQKAID